MSTSDFTTTILVGQTPEEVFSAIIDVRGWWHGEITGDSATVGDEFDYRMRDMHYSRQKVVELIPNQKVVWLVTDSKLNSYSDKSEWTGTRIIIEISPSGDKTQVKLTHEGLTPIFECYSACSGGWQMLIQQSLFSAITTGKGKAVFG